MLSSRIESHSEFYKVMILGPCTSHNIMVNGDSKILINSIKRAYCIPWHIKILVQVNINSVLAKNSFLFAEGCFRAVGFPPYPFKSIFSWDHASSRLFYGLGQCLFLDLRPRQHEVQNLGQVRPHECMAGLNFKAESESMSDRTFNDYSTSGVCLVIEGLLVRASN